MRYSSTKHFAGFQSELMESNINFSIKQFAGFIRIHKMAKYTEQNIRYVHELFPTLVS